MGLEGLGYVGIRAKNLDDWSTYGTRFLGMQLVDKSRGTLALRMDDRKQRVIVHADEDEGPSFYGWEVADAARSTPWRRIWKNAASMLRAVHVRWRRNGASRI